MADSDPLQDALECLIPAAPVDGRPRLIEFSFSRTQAGICCADVILDGGAGAPWPGRAHGSSSPTGELRVAAEAVLRALEQGRGQRLELLGVKALRAFDAMVVIVAVAADRQGVSTRLLGCALAGDDINRGAVLAALNATNRVLTAGAR
ncbi:MAG: hypothetical protein ACYC2G_16060 [Gemmatimonadaceae bacterium]